MHSVRSSALTVTLTTLTLITLLAVAWRPAQAQTVPSNEPIFLPMIMRPDGAVTPDATGISLELVSQLAEPAQAVAVLENYLYLGTGTTLSVVDISNPLTPMLLGHSEEVSDIITDIAAAPDYAYVSANDLHVINVSDPPYPWQEGFNDKPGPVTAIAVAGNFAYATITEFTPDPEFPTTSPIHSLRVIDISQKNHIIRKGIVEFPEPAHDIVVSGRYAYVADGSSGLRMIDIVSSFTPVEVGGFEVADSAQGVAINGRHAYVATSTQGILVINITDPPDLRQDTVHPLDGSATNIIVLGEYAYVSLARGGLLVLRITGDPAQTDPLFVEEDFYATPGVITDIAVDGSYIYVTDSTAGLLILQAAPTAN